MNNNTYINYLPYKKIMLNGTLAGLIYGVWAYFANDIGAISSAFTQASTSFILTFIVAFTLELINKKTPSIKVVIIYVIFIMVFLAIVQVSVHYLIHTENILQTVAPSLSIAGIYIILYILQLKNLKSESSYSLCKPTPNNELTMNVKKLWTKPT